MPWYALLPLNGYLHQHLSTSGFSDVPTSPSDISFRSTMEENSQAKLLLPGLDSRTGAGKRTEISRMNLPVQGPALSSGGTGISSSGDVNPGSTTVYQPYNMYVLHNT